MARVTAPHDHESVAAVVEAAVRRSACEDDARRGRCCQTACRAPGDGMATVEANLVRLASVSVSGHDRVAGAHLDALAAVDAPVLEQSQRAPAGCEWPGSDTPACTTCSRPQAAVVEPDRVIVQASTYAVSSHVTLQNQVRAAVHLGGDRPVSSAVPLDIRQAHPCAEAHLAHLPASPSNTPPASPGECRECRGLRPAHRW